MQRSVRWALVRSTLGVILAIGAPNGVTPEAWRLFAIVAATIHYGTTTSPIYFGANDVTQRDWWRLGFLTLLATTGIFTVIGLAWWKLLGWL